MPNTFEISIILITFLLVTTCIALALKIKKQKDSISKLNKIIQDLPFNFALSNANGQTSYLKTSNPDLDSAKSLSVFGHKECRLLKRSLDKLENITQKQTQLNCYSSSNPNIHNSIIINKIDDKSSEKNQYIITFLDTTESILKITKAENAFKYEKLFRTALQMIAQDKSFDDYTILILKNLTEWLSATRATVYTFEEDKATPLASYSKIKCDIETIKEINKNSKMYTLLKKQKLIFYDQNKKEQHSGVDMIINNLEQSKIKSSIVLSILDEDTLTGCICIDFFKNIKSPNDDQLATIYTAVNIINIACKRKKYLESVNAELKKLDDIQKADNIIEEPSEETIDSNSQNQESAVQNEISAENSNQQETSDSEISTAKN